MTTQKSELATYIARHLQIAQRDRTQREIAAEIGISSRNFLSMLSSGDAKLPIDRVSALAKAIGCDPRELMRLTLEEHFGATVAGEIRDLLGEPLTVNEAEVFAELRRVTKRKDPKVDVSSMTGMWLLFDQNEE